MSTARVYRGGRPRTQGRVHCVEQRQHLRRAVGERGDRVTEQGAGLV